MATSSGAQAGRIADALLDDNAAEPEEKMQMIDGGQEAVQQPAQPVYPEQQTHMDAQMQSFANVMMQVLQRQHEHHINTFQEVMQANSGGVPGALALGAPALGLEAPHATHTHIAQGAGIKHDNASRRLHRRHRRRRLPPGPHRHHHIRSR